jgi:hypothetical protein
MKFSPPMETMSCHALELSDLLSYSGRLDTLGMIDTLGRMVGCLGHCHIIRR